MNRSPDRVNHPPDRVNRPPDRVNRPPDRVNRPPDRVNAWFFMAYAMEVLRILWLLLGLLGALCPALALDWTPERDNFTYAMTNAPDGFWVGTETSGLWRRGGDGTWTHFSPQNGLSDDTVLCLATRGSQVWAGTARGGLCIWDGKAWTRVGVEEGLPSERVTSLSLDPDGDTMWVGTECGVARFRDADGWLWPSSPLCNRSVAGVASRGALVVVATACEGVMVSDDDGATWREVRGPQAPPDAPTGQGLPSDVCNDVKFDSLGHLWVATDSGLGLSRDGGKTWTFLRGQDWKANGEGATFPTPLRSMSVAVDLLAEEWVQSLAPTANGRMWLGFRQKGVELRDCASGNVAFSSQDDSSFGMGNSWARSVFPLPGQQALVARYKGGVGAVLKADYPPPTSFDKPEHRLPGAFAPTSQELTRRAATTPASPGSAIFESMDFRTQGDWVGRYGNDFALLAEPMDSRYISTSGYEAQTQLGLHVKPEVGGPYTYYTGDLPDERRALYMPTVGTRRFGELNDGTWREDVYSSAWEGPGLWVHVTVPEGAHRLAFYFVDNDAQGDDSLGRRDYIVRLHAGEQSLETAMRAPDLARARLRDAGGGGYARFDVIGPAQFWLQIDRHRSTVTKFNGLFLDRLDRVPATRTPALTWMGGMAVRPQPTPPLPDSATPELRSIAAAWEALDTSSTLEGGLAARWRTQIALMRAAQSAGASEELLANWRWKMALWHPEDRATFDATMKTARAKELEQEGKTQPK